MKFPWSKRDPTEGPQLTTIDHAKEKETADVLLADQHETSILAVRADLLFREFLRQQEQRERNTNEHKG